MLNVSKNKIKFIITILLSPILLCGIGSIYEIILKLGRHLGTLINCTFG